MPTYSDPTGSLELSNLRGRRRSELQDRAAGGENRAAMLLKFLEGDTEEDPYTGKMAHQRQSKIEDAMDFFRPDLKARRDEEQRLKVEQLGEPARMAGTYDVEQQRVANEGLPLKLAMSGAGKQTGKTPLLASGLMERVAGGANAIDSLGRLRKMREGGISTGPIAGRMQSFLQVMPVLPANAEFARFKAETDALKNATIKAITGAQMSEPEAKRIIGQIPTENDKPEIWSAKADALERVTRGLNKRIGLLQRGVPAEILDQIPVEDLEQYLGPDGE